MRGGLGRRGVCGAPPSFHTRAQARTTGALPTLLTDGRLKSTPAPPSHPRHPHTHCAAAPAGVIETTRPDTKNAQYAAVIKQGDALLNKIQKLSRVVTM